MSNLETLQATLELDDKEILRSLDNIAKAAKKMQNIFENAFNPSAPAKAAQQVDKLGTSTKQAGIEAQNAKRKYDILTSSVKKMSAYLIAGGGKQLIAMADEWKLVEGQLKNVVSSSNELKSLQKDLFDIAQKTKSSYGSTAGLYAKMANSNGDLSLTSADLLKITEATNKALAVSGSDVQQRAAAVKQLSQALNAGVLRGEEFNGIMQNGSRIAIALADSLGVTTDELRQMALDGTLSAQMVVDGLLQQSGAISAEYLRMGQTVAGSWEQLKNAALQYVGNTDKSISATNAFAKVLTGLANHFDILANLSALLGMAIAGGYGGAALANGIKQLGALKMALSASAKASRNFLAVTASRGFLAAMGPVGWAALAGSIVMSIGSIMLATRDLSDELLSSTQILDKYGDKMKEFASQVKGFEGLFDDKQGKAQTKFSLGNIEELESDALAASNNIKQAYSELPQIIRRALKDAGYGIRFDFGNASKTQMEEIAEIANSLGARIRGAQKNTRQFLQELASSRVIVESLKETIAGLSPSDTINFQIDREITALQKELKITKAIFREAGVGSGRDQFSILDSQIQRAFDTIRSGKELTNEEINKISQLGKGYGAIVDKLVLINDLQKEQIAQSNLSDNIKRQKNDSDEDSTILAHKERWLELARMSREEQELLNIQKRIENDLTKQIGEEQAKLISAQMAQEVYDTKELQKTIEELERLADIQLPLKQPIEQLKELAEAAEYTEGGFEQLKNAVQSIGEQNEDALAAWWDGLNQADTALLSTILNAENLQGVMGSSNSEVFQRAMTGVGKAAAGARAEIISLLQLAKGHVQSAMKNAFDAGDIYTGSQLSKQLGDINNFIANAEKVKVSDKKTSGGIKPRTQKKGGGGKSQASQEDKDLEKTLKDLQTPLEQYNKKLESLNAAKAQGKLTAEQYNEALSRLGRDMVGAGPTVEEVKGKLALLDEMLGNGTITWEEYSEKAINAMADLPGVMGDLASEVQKLSESFGSAFADMIVDGESFSESMNNILNTMAKNLISTAMTTLANQAVAQFMNMLSGNGTGFGAGFGGGLGGVISSIGKIFGFADGGKVQKYATGGFVSGGGTSRSDSIPAMLSNGEYVVNAKATKTYAPLLHAINNGNLKDLVYRAEGGFANVMDTTRAVTHAASSGKLAQGRGGYINLGGVSTGDTHITIQSSGNAELDQNAIREAQKQFQKNNEKQMEATFLKMMHKYKM